MATSATQHFLNDEEKEVLLERSSDLVFVDDVTELSCKRCGRVLINHYEANCGHLFCKECQRILSQGTGWNCPECREYITHIGDQHGEVEERVFGLMVHCLNHKYGCKHIMPLRQISNHLECCKERSEATLPKQLYTYSMEAASDRAQAISEMMNNMTETMNQKIKEMEKKQRVENENKWKEMENRISADLHREMIKFQSRIDESRNEMIKLNFKLSKMEETSFQHVEETEQVREMLQSQTAIDNAMTILDDNQRRHAERMKKKMVKYKKILVDTTSLQIQTADSCNQKITEMGKRVDEMKVTIDKVIVTRRAMSVVHTAILQMSHDQNKRPPMDKTDVHQGANVSNLDASSCVPEDSVVPEYNVLLLGESGSGKSTLVNALANYIEHDQLKEALSGSPARCLIPMTIVVADDDYQIKKIQIEMSEDCKIKVRDLNSTWRTYILDYNDCRVRLIKTFGYGRNNGSRLFATNILEFIGDCKFGIDIIAVMVKSSQPEIYPNLSGLFQSLLRNTNIRVLFFLSHSETTDYRPGDVTGPLQQRLRMQNLSAGVKLSKDNTYYFENKGFLYLLGHQCGHSYGAQFEDSCHRAWNNSALECKRLLQNLTARPIMSTIPRQLTQDLFVLEEARHCYILCDHYLKAISTNNEKYRKEFSQMHEKKNKLFRELNSSLQDGTIKYYDVKTTHLLKPEYFCASDKCIDVETRDGPVKHHHPRKCPTGSIPEILQPKCSHCPGNRAWLKQCRYNVDKLKQCLQGWMNVI